MSPPTAISIANPASRIDDGFAISTCMISVIAPVFNESACVDALMELLTDVKASGDERYDYQIVLVDDGSTDDTADRLEEMIANREGFRLIRHSENRGIAAAIHTGLRHADHEVAVSVDADGSYDLSLIPEMIPLLRRGVDMVTASPYHPQGGVENVAAWRIWLSKAASTLYRIAMRTKLHCYTSCYRVYRREAVLPLEPVNERYVGVAELLWRVEQSGGGVVEFPAVLSVRTAGQSKMRVFRAAFGHLKLIARIGLSRTFMQKKSFKHSPTKLQQKA